MRRKLSTIERLIDGNITYVIGVEGGITLERLRWALAQVQRKHPALRMLVSEQGDDIYYEMDAAGEIPLRILEKASESDVRREYLREVETVFRHDQPQLRVVWLRSGSDDNTLLVSTTHRICDGMSVLTIVRELLRGLYSDEALIPYEPITTQDIIGDYTDKDLWKRKLFARVINFFFRLLPSTRKPLNNKEVYLDWQTSEAFSEALKQRCKAENVSMHATLLMTLSEALQSKLGKRVPDWIESPMDARRGRLSALKSDMLFFGGGSFKVRVKQEGDGDFWSRAREMNQDIRVKIDQDIADIPKKYQFCEMIRPPSDAKMRSIVRLGDAVSRNGNWNLFSFSNLGNVKLVDDSAPFRVTNLQIYVHSFSVRILGLIAYALHGRLQFKYIGDDKCLSHEQALELKAEFMSLLEKRVGYTPESMPQPAAEVRALDAVAG